MTKRVYWYGNAAKSSVIGEILSRGPGGDAVTVFDYGCGDGGDWPAILADYPWLRLVGYEPYTPSRHKARERLRGLAARILGEDDLQTLDIKVEYVVSFSVLEHVVDRDAYLRQAKRILAPGGIFYLNYDDGHFRNWLDIAQPRTWSPAIRSWVRTVISRPLAAVGFSSRYQRRVDAADLERLLIKHGFRIERAEYHNLTCLKELAKTVSGEMQPAFATWWIDVEKTLNARFFVKLAETRYGHQSNLWLHMPSCTLTLRHV